MKAVMIRYLSLLSLASLLAPLGNSVNAAKYRGELISPASSASVARKIVGGTSIGSGDSRAKLWGLDDKVIDLHPAAFDFSEGYGIWQNEQVGMGTIANRRHALLWNGSADSVVDLHSLKFRDTNALATNGEQQVGNGTILTPGANNQVHALLWYGTAASVVDLNPTGFFYSVAEALSSTHQFGYGQSPSIRNYHALMWSGSPQSAVDLNPDGFLDSAIKDASETSQVGYGFGPATGERSHAILWRSTPDGVVDLHPLDFSSSVALGASSLYQVGFVSSIATSDHASLWQGTASSFIDLHNALANIPLAFSRSYALDVDDSRVVVGYGEAFDGRAYALRWIPVPEPEVAAFLPTTTIGLFTSRLLRQPRSLRHMRNRRPVGVNGSR